MTVFCEVREPKAEYVGVTFQTILLTSPRCVQTVMTHDSTPGHLYAMLVRFLQKIIISKLSIFEFFA